MLDAGQGLGNLLYGGGVGASYEAFATFTEGVARNQCHMLLHEDFFGEFLGGKAGGGDVRENVEGSFWLEAF